MPISIEHIDAIGRKKQRDVLYVVFVPPGKEMAEISDFNSDDFEFLENWRSNDTRDQFIAWMDEVGIEYCPCGEIARENGWSSYRGDLYIDVPYDYEDRRYQILEKKLENSDGTIKIPGISYRYMPLEVSLKNSHHDEPEFWEKWSKNF